MYKPKQKNITKLKSYLDKNNNEKSTTRERRCTRTK